MEIPAELGKNVKTLVAFIRCFLPPDVVLSSPNFALKEAKLASQSLQESACPQLKDATWFRPARASGTLKTLSVIRDTALQTVTSLSLVSTSTEKPVASHRFHNVLLFTRKCTEDTRQGGT